MLNLYRVLDLTDEKGLLCGKIPGDPGANVIKVERTGTLSGCTREAAPWQDVSTFRFATGESDIEIKENEKK